MDSFQGLTPKSPSSWHRSLAPKSWALLEDLSLYDNESWNDPRDFAKPVKAISLPQDSPSTSDCRLIELENQVQHLMEAHLAPKSPVQVNKIASSCEICSVPHDTQYCMENHEQAFIDYASSRTDEAGGKWFTFKPEQNNLGDTYNSSWKSYPNLRNSSSPKRVHVINIITIIIKEDEPRETGIVKPDTEDNDRDTIVKVEEESEESEEEEEEKEEDPEYINTNPQFPSNPEEESEEDESIVTGELGVEYFERFPTRSELIYHKVVLSEDDYKRGCERASDLGNGVYLDVDKLDPSYKEETDRINLDGPFKVGRSRRGEVSDERGIT
ncbi:hypothetical protein Tco_1570550 [Tanacetum coccineum]